MVHNDVVRLRLRRHAWGKVNADCSIQKRGSKDEKKTRDSDLLVGTIRMSQSAHLKATRGRGGGAPI